MSENNTKKHHYISVAEMSENSLNPDEKKRDRRKIYRFQKDGNFLNSLGEKNLEKENRFVDLYTFGLSALGEQYNLEDEFEKYEGLYRSASLSLLGFSKKVSEAIESQTSFDTLGDAVGNDLLYVLVLKFLNFLRNPYCIKDVIAKEPELFDFECNSSLSDTYLAKLDRYSNPGISDICREYVCTEQAYKAWLKILCKLMLDEVGGRNRLEEYIVRKLGSSCPNAELNLYFYDAQHSCVLNDKALRSFSGVVDGLDKSLYSNGGFFVKDFNINKNLFARLNVFPSVRGAGCGEINLEVCVQK